MAEAEIGLLRVLVVADDDGLRTAICDMLSLEGFEVAGAASGAEAITRAQELAATRPFDAMLVDMDLRGTCGAVALCRAVKKEIAALASTPLMFMASAPGGEAAAQLLQVGAEEFLPKPLNRSELAMRVRQLVKRSREERWFVERARRLAERIAERDDELDDLRRFAQDIVSSLPASLLVLDINRTIVFVNAPFLELLHAVRQDVVSENLAKFLEEPDPGGPVERALDLAVKENRPSRLLRVPGFLRGTAGRVFDLSAAPIDYSGTRHVLVVVEDVTEQAQTERAVATERAKLNDVVNALSAALCLIDRTYLTDKPSPIVWRNRMFDTWFGDAPNQPGAAAFRAMLTEDDGWVLPVFAQGQTRQVARRMYSVGQPRHFIHIIAPVKVEGRQDVEQALVLTQDVTDQESHVEQLTLLRDLSQYLRGTLDAERLNQVILICVTAGHALGFNRAFLFRRVRGSNLLEGRAAIGPTSREEAFGIWGQLAAQNPSLPELIAEAERRPPQEGRGLVALVRGLRYRMEDSAEIVARTALERRYQLVTDANADPRVTDAFRQTFHTTQFVAVPMVAKNTVVGVILADNCYSGRPLTEEHVRLLSLFAAQAAMAIENADTFAELEARMEELRTAHDRIVRAEKLAAIGQLAGQVAHEIRNPLVNIGGFARSILDHTELSPAVREKAQIIADEVVRLENLLRGVMDFSRPNPPVLRPGDLNQAIQRAARIFTDQLTRQRVEVRLDLDWSLSELSFDENQIVQVLTNLVRNAGESMSGGGLLTITTRRQRDMALLQVVDSGCGIPANVVPRVFNPFFTTKTNGTGLGLAVTQKIVDDHGGRIDLESTVGKGTKVSILLPLQRLPAPSAGVAKPT